MSLRDPATGRFIPASEPEPESLQEQLRLLQLEVSRLKREKLSEAVIRDEIIRIAHAKPPIPSWVTSIPGPAHSPGVPTLFASDWHWGEVIQPGEINGVNEYSIAIAHRRAKALISQTIELLDKHMVNPNYPGIVFALGGDMFSGNIHDELKETNEVPIMPALLDLYGCLIWCIETLANRYGKVFIPCVTGNHARNTLKIHAKRRCHESFDWLLYTLLDKHFEEDDRINFLISDGPDAYYRVYNHRYLLTHGDQFRGGDGMVGALGPLCVAPETLILKSDLTYIRADELRVGDSLIGFEEEPLPGERRCFKESVVGEIRKLELECYEIETDDGQKTIASVDHPWLIRSGDGHGWSKTQHLRIGTRIISLGKPWMKSESYEAGYLAGVLDGEGSLERHGRIKFSQQENACMAQTCAILDKMGIPYRKNENGASAKGYEACFSVALFNGREDGPREKTRVDTWNLLGTLRPERLIREYGQRTWEDTSIQVARDVRVIGIRHVGLREVAAFSTSTHTFIGNGMLMHNTRGDHKKRSRNGQIGQDYDTLVVGHFHQLMQMPKLIVNGALCGYNEYAFSNNFPYEIPQQALWLTHPKRGITFHMAVKLENNSDTKATDWVSWRDK